MTIELHTPSASSLDNKIRYAQTLADAKLLPAAYRGSPANILLAIDLGEALGIPAIQAIQSIHVIEGKPSASADLIGSLVRRAGHKLRITESEGSDGPVVTAQLIRADDPDFTFTAIWTTAKARDAGLWGKGNWAKYPGQMMRNRAITEVCRQGAGDALYGVIYDPEELGAVEVTQVAVEPKPKPEPRAAPMSLAEAVAQQQQPDFASRIPDLTTSAEARALWQEAKRAGSPAGVLDLIAERGRELAPAEPEPDYDPATGEVHDAELITDTDTESE